MRTSLVALVGMVLAAGCSSDEPYDMNNEAEAEAQCEGFVEERLKAPASAEFDLAADYAAGVWTVSGTVDSQNGFGAMLRNSVSCEIIMNNDTGTAQLIDIALG